MGSGKAARRRAKNAEAANVSLHKAALGKGTAHMPLPAAPTKDDYKDRMSASLRRMLALKEAAEQPSKRRKIQQGQSIPQGQFTAQPSRSTAESDHNVSSSSTDQPKKQQHPQQIVLDGGPAWQEPKRLKQRKKDYLNAKKLKKKGKHKLQTDSTELLLDRPAFGEVVHAPPSGALKSKHWAAGHQPQQQRQQKQHPQQQQKHHLQRQQQKQHLQRQSAAATPATKGRHKLRPAQPPKSDVEAAELQQIKEQLVSKYRAGRPAPREGRATLASLKELVQT